MRQSQIEWHCTEYLTSSIQKHQGHDWRILRVEKNKKWCLNMMQEPILFPGSEKGVEKVEKNTIILVGLLIEMYQC